MILPSLFPYDSAYLNKGAIITAFIKSSLFFESKKFIYKYRTFVEKGKAVSIAAALEVGRRRRMEDTQKITKITSSKDAFELLYPLIGELPHEEFWIVYLNNSNKVIHKSQLSKGGITGTLVDVRLVLKQALELGAVGIILAHNHPSGTLKPSVADKQITEKLKKASEALDIKVLDHLIVTHHQYVSFADKGIL